jgi:phosphatidylglycerophosphate synthase
VDVRVRGQVGERAAVPVLAAAAMLAIVASAWLLIAREPRPAGWIALVAGVFLVVGGALLRAGDRRARVALSFADRVFDGCILAALAWVVRSSRPAVAAGALVALAAGFLASYIRAKGGSLGYGIEEGVVTPILRYGLLSLALIFGWTPWAVWVVAGVTVLAAVVRASQVAKEERA